MLSHAVEDARRSCLRQSERRGNQQCQHDGIAGCYITGPDPGGDDLFAQNDQRRSDGKNHQGAGAIAGDEDFSQMCGVSACGGLPRHGNEDLGQTADDFHGVIHQSVADGEERDGSNREHGRDHQFISLEAELVGDHQGKTCAAVARDLSERAALDVTPAQRDAEQTKSNHGAHGRGQQWQRYRDQRHSQQAVAVGEGEQDQSGAGQRCRQVGHVHRVEPAQTFQHSAEQAGRKSDGDRATDHQEKHFGGGKKVQGDAKQGPCPGADGQGRQHGGDSNRGIQSETGVDEPRQAVAVLGSAVGGNEPDHRGADAEIEQPVIAGH